MTNYIRSGVLLMTLVLLPGLIRSVPAFWARIGLYDRRSNLTVQTLIRFNEPQELTWPVLTWVKYRPARLR